ncbi:MAG: DUF2796 domain-containing protein [Hyphomicrobiaceae bacterium]
MHSSRMPLAAALTGLAVALAASTAAAQKRELGAHEHGAGTLNIAIEKSKVEFELEVPGDDIVGFEHQAKTAKQKAAVEKARKTLSGALALFKLPTGAGCKLASAKVELHTEEAEKKADTKPAEGKHDHAHEKDHDEGGHTEFHATYALDCRAPEKLTEIAFDYFKTFRKAQKLTVTVVSDKGQKQYQVTRKAPRLVLGGNS